MAGVSKEINEIMWAATQVIYQVNDDGSFPKGYKDNPYYKEAKFTGDIYGFVDSETKTNAGMVGISEVGVIVSFRGTLSKSIQDWLNDFNADQVDYPSFGGRVHRGFLQCLESICDGMIVTINELLKVSPEKVVYITGHSKGGAMSALMATKLKDISRDMIKVVTFGGPRVGDAEFASRYNFEMYRYEAFLDMVPHVPFTKQEQVLLPRLSNITEGAINSSSSIVKYFNKILKGESFVPVGAYVCVDKDHGKYSDVPKDLNKTSGETLDSLCSIDWFIRDGHANDLGTVHCNDYGKKH